mgnify:CR=1 FL=1
MQTSQISVLDGVLTIKKRRHRHINPLPGSVNTKHDRRAAMPLRKGTRVTVYWEDDARWYDGAVAEYSTVDQEHLIRYDDGDQRYYNLSPDSTISWKLLEVPAPEPVDDAEAEEEDQEEEGEEDQEDREEADDDDDGDDDYENDEEQLEPAEPPKKKAKAARTSAGDSAAANAAPPPAAKLKAATDVKKNGHTKVDALALFEGDSDFTMIPPSEKSTFTNVAFGPFDKGKASNNLNKYLLCIQHAGGIWARHLFAAQDPDLTFADRCHGHPSGRRLNPVGRSSPLLVHRRSSETRGHGPNGGSHHYMLSKQVKLARIKKVCLELKRLQEAGKLSRSCGTEGFHDDGAGEEE